MRSNSLLLRWSKHLLRSVSRQCTNTHVKVIWAIQDSTSSRSILWWFLWLWEVLSLKMIMGRWESDPRMLHGLVGEVIMSSLGRAAAHKNFDDSQAEELVSESFGKLFRLPTEEDEIEYEEEDESNKPVPEESSSLWAFFLFNNYDWIKERSCRLFIREFVLRVEMSEWGEGAFTQTI